MRGSATAPAASRTSWWVSRTSKIREPAASAPCSVAFTCDRRLIGVYIRNSAARNETNRPGVSSPVADLVAAVEEGAHQRQAADGLHERRQEGGGARDAQVHVQEPRRGAAEALDLEGLHREGLHDPEAGDGLLEDLRDVAPAPERGLARGAQAPPSADEGEERERHADERDEREAPVLDEQDR